MNAFSKPIPSTPGSQLVPAQTRSRVQRGLETLPGLDDTYAPDYHANMWLSSAVDGAGGPT